MFDKKQSSFKTPNLRELQEVVIDARTKIYIGIGDSPEEARSRYLTRQEAKNKVQLAIRKPVAS